MAEKEWKGMLLMKLKLGFWIGDEKSESGETAFAPPPPPTIDDSTWQSPYILTSLLPDPNSYPPLRP